MAIRRILTYPNETLKKKALSVGKLKREDRALIQDLIDTMYQEEGVGIAAPQVGVSKRIIIISPNATKGEERVLINPEILHASKEEALGTEGCLSVPGISGEIRRAVSVRISALDERGKTFTEEWTGFPAHIVQHEIDHLNGILLIDRLEFNQKQALMNSYQRL